MSKVFYFINMGRMRRTLMYVLAFQLSLPPFASARTESVFPHEGLSQIYGDTLERQIRAVEIDFAHANPEMFDQDPFFLRKIFWHNRSQPSSPDFTVTSESGHVRIRSRLMKADLDLALSLRQVHEDPYYIYFLPTADSDIFREKNGSPNPLQALFVVSKADLVMKSQSADLTLASSLPPLYAVPLFGNWTADDRTEILDSGVNEIYLTNYQGLRAQLTLEDIEQAVQIGHQNLLISGLLAPERERYEQQNVAAILASIGHGGLPEFHYGYAPRGSTALYGLIPTGINLDDPERSVARRHGGGFARNSLVARMANLLLPQAHGLGTIPPEYSMFLVRAAYLCAGTYLTGFALRWAAYRERFAAIDALHLEAKIARVAKLPKDERDRTVMRDPELRQLPPSFWTTAYRELLAKPVAVQGQLLTAVGTGPVVLISDGLTYLKDRLFPQAAFEDQKSFKERSGFLYKFIFGPVIKSFIFERGRGVGFASNLRTVVNGILIWGLIDTSITGFLMLYVQPLFLGDAQNNPDSMRFVMSEITRNAWMYMFMGAFSYTQDLVSRIKQSCEARVKAAFAAAGKFVDADKARYQAEYERAVAEDIAEQLVNRSLPDPREEFLIDAATIIDRFRGLFFGYKVPASKPAEDYVLAHGRQGMLAASLELALSEAREISRRLGNRGEAKRLVRRLETLNNDYRMLGGGMRAAYKTKGMLTTLSYRGPLTEPVDERFLPEAWVSEDGPVVAEAAAFLFRSSFFWHLDANSSLAGLTQQPVGQGLQSPVAPTNLAEMIWARRRFVAAAVRASEEKAFSAYQPPLTHDAIEQMQDAAAKAAADLEVESAGPSDQAELWRHSYTQALAKQVGVHIDINDSSDLILKVRHDTEALVGEMLTYNEAIRKYRVHLDPQRQKQFDAQLYATQFLITYEKNTVRAETPLESGLSDLQPGKYQQRRQQTHSWLGKLILRMRESAYHPESFQPGAENLKNRTWPLRGYFKAGWSSGWPRFYAMIFGAYLGNRYIGAVDQTWITYVMLYSTTWASTMATGFNDNFWSTYLGIKPNSNPVNKIGFAIAHALVTYPTLILITLLAPVANKSFNAVVDPIFDAASEAAKKVLPRFSSEAAEPRADCATALEN